MKVFAPTDLIPVNAVSMLLFGAPGIWKTSIAQTANNPLTLDFDGGAKRVFNRQRVLQVDNWAEMGLKEVKDEMQACGTVVIDTVGRMLDFMSAAVAAQNAKHTTGTGNLTMQGWGVLKGTFTFWMKQLLLLGKDVVMIAHEREEKDGDARLMRPDIQGGSYSEVMKATDLIGYLRILNGQRVLSFNPTDQWVGKNAAGWADFAVPDLKERPQFLASLLAEAKAKMGGVAQESKKIADDLAKLKEMLETFGANDLEKFDAAIATANDMAKPIAMQYKKAINARMKKLDIEWDKNAKKCVRKAPDPAELPAVEGAA